MAEKQTGRSAAQVRAHAVQWYRLAAPDLTGLALAAVQKRIGQLADPSAPPGKADPRLSRAPAWDFTVKTYCAEGPLLSFVEVPSEFDAKYAKGAGSVSGVKHSDAINIGGIMRGFFGKALIWTVPAADGLNASVRLEAKFPARHELLVYDTDKGFGPGDGGQYHGALLARAGVDVKPDNPTTLVVRTDPKTGATDILNDGKSLLTKPFTRDRGRAVLLVLAIYGRDPGQKVDTTFNLTSP